jgi:hypothetical protein
LWGRGSGILGGLAVWLAKIIILPSLKSMKEFLAFFIGDP